MLAMHRLRRFAAALLGVLLLQVVLLGSSAVCPEMRVAATGAGSQVAGDEHAGHAGHHAGAPAQRDDATTNPRTPVPPHCVIAMNCSMVAVAGTTAGLSAADAIPTALVAALDDTAPASRRGAPEPPPPRG